MTVLENFSLNQKTLYQLHSLVLLWLVYPSKVFKNHSAGLQITLGGNVYKSPKLITKMHGFRMSCSYVWSDQQLVLPQTSSLPGLSDASSGLIQAVTDNFDADI